MRIKSIRVSRVIGIHAHFLIPATKYALRYDSQTFGCPGVFVDFPQGPRFVPMTNIDEIEIEPEAKTDQDDIDRNANTVAGRYGAQAADRKSAKARVSPSA